MQGIGWTLSWSQAAFVRIGRGLDGRARIMLFAMGLGLLPPAISKAFLVVGLNFRPEIYHSKAGVAHKSGVFKGGRGKVGSRGGRSKA